MKAKKLVSLLLIFVLIMPVMITVTSGVAYAFDGLDFSGGFLDVLKGLLALFFLNKFVDTDKEADVADNPENSSDDSLSNSSENNQEEVNTNDTSLQKDWTSMQVDELSVDEEEMLRLVNKEREKEGLRSLKIDLRLVKVARAKSQDMIDEEYFDHFSSNYGSPFDMMHRLDINYYLAGETIAGASTVRSAHQALMNSPGHRSNILNPDYTHIGIGIIKGGPYGRMYSQEFADLRE